MDAHGHFPFLKETILFLALSGVLMPLLFGSAGALVGAAGVFWVTGAVVGLGARLPLKVSGRPHP